MEAVAWVTDLEPMWALTIILLGGNIAQWHQAQKERKAREDLSDKFIAAMNEMATTQALIMDRLQR